jgi:hypothetical protein
VAHASCWPHFFEYSQSTWHGFSQFKQRLFICQCWIFCSVGGLNYVLLIFMGSSIGKIAKGWGGMIGAKLCCVMCVDSQCLSYQCLKVYCDIEQLVQWLNLRLRGLTWWITNLSHCCVVQIETSRFISWNVKNKLFKIWCIHYCQVWSLANIL